MGAILVRSGRALLEASERSRVSSLGAPVLVIGHSAGGVNARLLTSPEPFAGRRLGGSGRIGAIVTLGSPNVVRADGDLGARIAAEPSAFANRVVPGAAFAPAVGYLSVGSRQVVGSERGSSAEQRLWRVYRRLDPGPPAGSVEGDGLIPVGSAVLPGAPSIVLDDAVHGQWPGQWYGSDGPIDEWWPQALETWRAALVARAMAALADDVAGASDHESGRVATTLVTAQAGLSPGGAFDGSADRR